MGAKRRWCSSIGFDQLREVNALTEPTLQNLLAEDFEPITDWILDGDRIRLASLDWAETSGWLYAFVVEGSFVEYVGLTTRILRSRMDNYRDGKVDQNARLRGLISEALSEGKRVTIYGKRNPDLRRLEAEEFRLRKAWTPGWNRM
jgi:hypothetical protein